MDFRKQEAPFCVQLELSLGCNLSCSFCGLSGIQEQAGHGLRFMTLDDATLIAQRIHDSGWNCRLEFARRGEPSMNPQMTEIIAIFRRLNPTLQIMITSNGGGLLKKPGPVANVMALFEAGLNILALDDYKDVNIVPKIKAAVLENVLQFAGAEISLWDYPEQSAGNPHRRYGIKHKMISFIADITEAKSGTHGKLNNHAGHGAPLDLTYLKPCAKPFREIGINWDATIDLCCIDWASEYRVGDLHESSLEEIWQHERMNVARQYLIDGQRQALRPCHGCDHPSYRIGLLPDPLGKQDLPKPTEWSASVIHETLSEGPREHTTARARANIGPVLPDFLKEKWGL